MLFIQDISKALPLFPLVNESNNATEESDGNGNDYDSSSIATIDKRRDLIVNHYHRDCNDNLCSCYDEAKHRFVPINPLVTMLVLSINIVRNSINVFE